MMSNRFFKAEFLLFLVIGISCNQGDKVTDKATQDAPPNIVYILVDDMGYGDLGSFGQKVLKTPHIDQLVASGMKFTSHYAGATVCAPSRASMLTGKQPGRSSVRSNEPEGQLIRDEEITIPEALKKAGYISAVIGKWGVGNPPTPTDPLRNGFNEYYGYINMWHAHNFYPEFLYRNAEKEALSGNKTDWSYDYAYYHPDGMPEGTGVASEKGTYVLGEFENEAAGFIERNADKPFFLYLALNMPHANNEAGYFLDNGMEVPMMEIDGKKVPDYGAYADQNWPDPEKGFAQMIHLIDQTVGQLEDKLAQLGLTENTVVMFASDNGPHEEGGHKVAFFDSNGPLRGAKRDLYEGGIRVPMAVKWPGHIKAGSTSDLPCSFWDLLPTFCDLAGTVKPEDIDGISFAPTLLGNSDSQQMHEHLYWEFYEMGGRQAVRQGDWKYIKLNVRDKSKPIQRELYRLDLDPGETHNIIEQHQEVAARMDSLMQVSHQPHPQLSLFQMDKDLESPL